MKRIHLVILLSYIFILMPCTDIFSQSAQINGVMTGTDITSTTDFRRTPEPTHSQIYVNMNISGAKDKELELVVYFYHADGRPLRDTNKSYYTSDGNVCVSKTITPRYDNAYYEKLLIEVPSSELHFTQDCTTTIRLTFQLYYNNKPILSSSYEHECVFIREKRYCQKCNNGICMWCEGKGYKLLPGAYGSYQVHCHLCNAGKCASCGGKGYVLLQGIKIQQSGSMDNSQSTYSEPVPMPMYGPTPSSNGSSTTRTCPVCGGKGKNDLGVTYAPGNNKSWCSYCNETTFKHTHKWSTCSACRGSGVIK